MEQAIEEPPEDVLLVEYQAAQESAQHHDNAFWIVTGILWGGMLTMMGFVANGLSEPKYKLFLLALCAIGFILCLFVLVNMRILLSVKKQKYQRCKEIEAIYGMKQHTELKYPRYIGQVFCTIITVALGVIWVLFAWTICNPPVPCATKKEPSAQNRSNKEPALDKKADEVKDSKNATSRSP